MHRRKAAQAAANAAAQQLVYLDNASTTQLAPQVLQAMLPYLQQHYANPSSPHQQGNLVRAALEQARRTIATLIGAQQGHLFFTSGGTEANSWALQGVLENHQITHVITSAIEHASVLQPLAALVKAGRLSRSYVPLDAQGAVRYEALEALLAAHSGVLVSLMHGNNELGNVTDIARVGGLCRRYGALFHSDMVQTLGRLQIDLAPLPVDLASGSAHKLHGPKGVGLLYVREGVRLASLQQGGMQERGLRGGTEPVAAIIGFAKALEIAYAQLQATQAHLQGLKQHLINRLGEALPHVRLHGQAATPSESLPAIVNLGLPEGVDAQTLVLQLSMRGIAAASGSACMSGSAGPSHVLTALGLGQRPALRLSMSQHTTKAALEYTVAQLVEICGRQGGSDTRG